MGARGTSYAKLPSGMQFGSRMAKTMDSKNNSKNTMFEAIRDPKLIPDGPKWSQHGAKMEPKWSPQVIKIEV
jgi:hypothetical protein